MSLLSTHTDYRFSSCTSLKGFMKSPCRQGAFEKPKRIDIKCQTRLLSFISPLHSRQNDVPKHLYNILQSCHIIAGQWHQMPCFFLLFTGYIFSSCLRVAYALPTPLRCFPTRGLFVLICLRVPTLTNCFLILPTRLACVASVGFLLVLILHILPTRWAPVLPVEVVFFVLLGAASHITTTKHNLQYHNKTLPPTPPTQKKILTTILKCLRKAYARKRNAYASTSQDILCIN